MRNTIQLRSRILIALLVGILSIAGETAASAQTTVGGHIGILVPWVTHAGGNTTTVFDTFSLGLPFGVSIKGQGRMFVDFEFIPHINEAPHLATLTVDPRGALATESWVHDRVACDVQCKFILDRIRSNSE